MQLRILLVSEFNSIFYSKCHYLLILFRSLSNSIIISRKANLVSKVPPPAPPSIAGNGWPAGTIISPEDNIAGYVSLGNPEGTTPPSLKPGIALNNAVTPAAATAAIAKPING